MAGESKQIYQLTNGTFNGSSLVPFEVPNTDSSTSAERPYITRKTTGDEVSEFVAKTQEFETDLETDNKTIIGAINELKEGGGGNANYVELTQAEYDELTEEEKHNGKMYFITDGGSDGSIIDDEATSTETTWSSQKISEIQNGTTYNVGDSFSASIYKHCAGRTVNAGNAVLCFYPTAKPIASNVQSASMNLTQGICYTATGGIALKAGTYQGTITDGGIYFNITLNSSFSDGGRNATVEFQNRTITFN